MDHPPLLAISSIHRILHSHFETLFFSSINALSVLVPSPPFSHKPNLSQISKIKTPTLRLHTPSRQPPFICTYTRTPKDQATSTMELIQVSKLLCICLTLFSLVTLSKSHNADENVRQVCSVTRYKNLCISSLASYSKTAKTNHTAWARAGVSVALSEIKNTTHYLEKVNKSQTIRGRENRGAMSDCVECFYDAKDSLHQSLSVIRELDKVTFDQQMGDVMTWVSAALTEEDTCLDGFNEEGAMRIGRRRGSGRRQRAVRMVMERVRNCTYVTSNALALLNKLASTGLK